MRFRSALRMPWINGGLAVLLAVAVVLAFTVIGNPTPPPVPVRTAVVTRGDVTATVTGSGNTDSSVSTPVSFTTDGTVTAVDVKAGDSVTLGQVLATVDPAASQEGLRTAQAALDGARAAYQQAAAGPTDVKKQQDQQAVTSAQQGVDNANTSVQNARAQLALDTKSLSTGVSNARTQLANDRASTATSVRTAQVQLSTDSTAQNNAVSTAAINENSACSGVVLQAFSTPLVTGSSGSTTTAGTPTTTAAPTTTAPTTTAPTTTAPTTSRTTTTSVPTIPTTTTTPSSGGVGTGTTSTSTSTGGLSTGTSTGTASSCDSARQARDTAEDNRTAVLRKDQLAVTSAQQSQAATLDKDQQAVTTAQQTQSDSLLKDKQAITTNQQSVVTAQGQVTSARLAAEADLHPETPDQIAQARSNVASAQVQVDTAERALDGTALKAPQAGVVLAVNGKVGESSGSGTSGSGTTSSTTTGTGTSSNASSATAAEASAGTGFITIANPTELAVTADIAEADAAGLQLGQQATVTFPATNGSATGTVTQITPQSTVTNNVVLYPITVSLDAAPPGVKVGSTASLAITDGTATGVLEVPTAAITTVGTNHTVVVRRNGVDTPTPVGVGLTGATTTEITSGLAAGDVLVLPSPTATTPTGAGAGFPRLGGGR